MQKIGIFGGNSVYELGYQAEVAAFFSCISRHAALSTSELELLDRLKRRYLRQDELEPARVLMSKIRNQLLQVRTAEVQWQTFGFDTTNTALPLDAWTTADVFARYFDRIEDAIACALSFFDYFKIYQAVRIVRYDLAGFVNDDGRPLAEHDRLEGEPLWLG